MSTCRPSRQPVITSTSVTFPGRSTTGASPKSPKPCGSDRKCPVAGASRVVEVQAESARAVATVVAAGFIGVEHAVDLQVELLRIGDVVDDGPGLPVRLEGERPVAKHPAAGGPGESQVLQRLQRDHRDVAAEQPGTEDHPPVGDDDVLERPGTPRAPTRPPGPTPRRPRSRSPRPPPAARPPPSSAPATAWPGAAGP